jgi:hypothetical protein
MMVGKRPYRWLALPCAIINPVISSAALALTGKQYSLTSHAVTQLKTGKVFVWSDIWRLQQYSNPMEAPEQTCSSFETDHEFDKV